jgi:O-acetylserine/cysteine efflux transporter
MPLQPSHLAAALLMVIIWGFNFVVIRWGLENAPPLLLTFLRFLVASVPLVFFIKPPRAPWQLVFAYGAFAFGGQFSLLFLGMHAGFTAGLASLVIQVQVFITIGVVAATMHERPRVHQLIGAAVAAAGLVLVAIHLPRGGSLLGFFLVLLAAGSWTVANLLIKRIGNVDPLALVVWGSLASCPLLLVASLALEGPRRIAQALAIMGPLDWLGVAFQAGPTTLLAFGVWAWLLRKHPAASVTPFALLVPVAGMASAAIFLGEPMQWWKLAGGALVLAGLALNVFGGRFGTRAVSPPVA